MVCYFFAVSVALDDRFSQSRLLHVIELITDLNPLPILPIQRGLLEKYFRSVIFGCPGLSARAVARTQPRFEAVILRLLFEEAPSLASSPDVFAASEDEFSTASPIELASPRHATQAHDPPSPPKAPDPKRTRSTASRSNEQPTEKGKAPERGRQSSSTHTAQSRPERASSSRGRSRTRTDTRASSQQKRPSRPRSLSPYNIFIHRLAMVPVSDNSFLPFLLTSFHSVRSAHMASVLAPSFAKTWSISNPLAIRTSHRSFRVKVPTTLR